MENIKSIDKSALDELEKERNRIAGADIPDEAKREALHALQMKEYRLLGSIRKK